MTTPSRACMPCSCGSRGESPPGAARRFPGVAPRRWTTSACRPRTTRSWPLLAKLDTYRGTARFTTWACKFAIFEASSRLRRHAWRQRKIEIDDTVWDRLPDKAPPALQQLENDQAIVALHRAVDEHLTERQRLIFQSVTLDETPIDVLAERLGTSRGAIYKTLHDARAKLRRALIASGHGERVS